MRSIHVWMAGFVLWSATTYLWSTAPELTWTRIGTYVQMLGFVWLLWQFAESTLQQDGLMTAYVVGSYLSAAGTISNYLAGAASPELRYAATGFDANELGLMLALSLPMGLYLARRQSSMLLKLFFQCHLPFVALGLLLTASRAAVLAAALGLMAGCWGIGAPGRRIGRISGVVISVAAVAVWLVPETSWRRLSTMEDSIRDAKLSQREKIWAAGLRVFPEHPIIGVGAGTYAVAVPPVAGKPKVAHNVFISVLVETGIIGFLVYLALLVLLAKYAFRLSSPQRALWCALLLIWIAGVMSLTWEASKATWFLFGLLASQSYSARRAALLQNQRAYENSRDPYCPFPGAGWR
jgi:O-antigen ligase